MRVVKRILLGLGAILVLLAVVGLILPSRVRVQRSIVIQAPAEEIFVRVDNLSAWPEWSPWYDAEPDAKYVYSGPEAGKGATVEWEGEIIGTGKQVITESVANSSVETTLDFGPQGTATSAWTFQESDDDGTSVTWGFDTDLGMNPISRYFGLMMNRWIGADYEKGLNSLKTVCEANTSSGDATNETDTPAENSGDTPEGDSPAAD